MQLPVQIKKLNSNSTLPLPNYATEHSAGMDLMAEVDTNITISPGEVKIIPTGIAIALPEGFEAQIRPRSGLAAKNFITVLNSPGTIDADYRGEIKVILVNHGKNDFIIEHGMRIAQMIIAKYERVTWQEVENLGATDRGEGGFGSTGIKKQG